MAVRGFGEGAINRQRKEDFYGSKNALCDTIMVDTCHSTFVQTHRMYHTKSEPFVNCRLWVMMSQSKFINCDKCTTLWGMLIMGEAVCVRKGDRNMRNLCTFHSIIL